MVKRLVIVLLLSSAVQAATWYIDPDASGSNNGTSWTNAWTAWHWPGDGVTAGDTVYVRGRVTEDISQTTPANAASWTTYIADPESSATIAVGVRLGPTSSKAVTLETYYEFRGFHVPSGFYFHDVNAVKVTDCNVCNLDSVYTDYPGPYTPAYSAGSAAFYCKDSLNITIEDCNIWRGYAGIYAIDDNSQPLGDSMTISGCNIHDIAARAIHQMYSNSVIEDTTIADANSGHTEVYISGSMTGTISVGDTVTQATTGATGWVNRITSALYIIYTCDRTATPFQSGYAINKDGGGGSWTPTGVDAVHTDGFQLDGGAAYDNIVFRRLTINRGGTEGLKFKGTSSQYNITNIVIENCLIWDSGDCGIIAAGTHFSRIVNNTIIAPNAAAEAIRLECGPTRYGNKIDVMYNNLIDDLDIEGDYSGRYNWIAASGYNIFEEEPQTGGVTYPFTKDATDTTIASWSTAGIFTNYASDDFTLAENSPAIDAGVNNEYTPDEDVEGTARSGKMDIGAYDAGGEAEEEEEEEEEVVSPHIRKAEKSFLNRRQNRFTGRGRL